MIQENFSEAKNNLENCIGCQEMTLVALVKEEGCDRRGEPTLNLAIIMEMKPERKPLGSNPLSDASYRNPGMVLNGQGPGRHPLGDTLVSRSRHGVK